MSANPLLKRAVAILAAVATLTAICLAIIVARSWRASRQAVDQMRVEFSAQKAVLDQADGREAQRHAVLARALAQLSRADRAAITPAAIARALPAAFLPLPRPITAALAPEASGAPPTEAPLQPPAIIHVPQQDLKPMLDQLESCRECRERLAVAQQDLADERAKLSALTAERNAAAKAARGGGFWTRMRLGAKWFVIGAAAGALAASAAHR